MNRPACDPLRHSHHGQNQPSPACPGCSSPCPACGYPEYGCPGHGVSRDPLGWSILNRHEVGDHSSCHIAAACHVGAVAVVHDPIVHERGEITCTCGEFPSGSALLASDAVAAFNEHASIGSPARAGVTGCI